MKTKKIAAAVTLGAAAYAALTVWAVYTQVVKDNQKYKYDRRPIKVNDENFQQALRAVRNGNGDIRVYTPEDGRREDLEAKVGEILARSGPEELWYSSTTGWYVRDSSRYPENAIIRTSDETEIEFLPDDASKVDWPYELSDNR